MLNSFQRLEDEAIYKTATTPARRPTMAPTPAATDCAAFWVTSPAPVLLGLGELVVIVPLLGLLVVAGAVVPVSVPVVEAGPEEVVEAGEAAEVSEVDADVDSAVLVLAGVARAAAHTLSRADWTWVRSPSWVHDAIRQGTAMDWKPSLSAARQ